MKGEDVDAWDKVDIDILFAMSAAWAAIAGVIALGAGRSPWWYMIASGLSYLGVGLWSKIREIRRGER